MSITEKFNEYFLLISNNMLVLLELEICTRELAVFVT